MDILVVPAHLKKVNWAVAFLTSLHRSGGGIPDDIEILFVCSNQAETEGFSNILINLGLADKVRFMNVETYSKAHFSSVLTEALNTNAKNAIVNLKKFLALHWARARSADFCMTVDLDVFLTQDCDLGALFAKAKKNYAKNVLFGAKIAPVLSNTSMPAINAASARIFSPEDTLKLGEAGVQDIFTWFLEPPCYALEDVSDFFDHMSEVHGSFEAFLLALEWHMFDVFSYYRFLYRDFKIKDYRDLGILVPPELISLAELDLLRTATGFDPVWLPFLSFTKAPAFARTMFPDAGMLYHFDRV